MSGAHTDERTRPTAPAASVGPGPSSSEPTTRSPVAYRKALTALVAIAPFPAIVFLVATRSDDPFPWRELGLLVVLSMLVGHGVTVGFHRLFAHRSFRARRPLKIALATLGSMSVQGSVIGWVADHRRHHRFADRPGDPHSPFWKRDVPTQGARGLWHAHLGWCFTNNATPRERYAADLMADRDLRIIDRLFIPLTAFSLLLPFAIGFVWSGTLAGAVVALLWAGVVRVGITHNFTWSINSICHRFGRRTFQTRDTSTNVALLAPFTMGESWHNNHHAFPRSARHGLDSHQFDSSARLIRWFEQLGWATDVVLPTARELEARRADVRSGSECRGAV
jgi:stearoyl-CoA desaturase (Delta-9 desaturase)